MDVARVLAVRKTGSAHSGAGAFGDLIGVPGDPLQHRELAGPKETVQLVVKGGEVVKDRETANV